MKRAGGRSLAGVLGLLLVVAGCGPAASPDPVLVWSNPRRYPLPWFPIELSRDSLVRWRSLAVHQLPLLVDSLRGDTLPCQWDDLDGDGQWDTYVTAIRLGKAPLATAHPDSSPRRSFRLVAVDSTGLRQRWRRRVAAQQIAAQLGELRSDSLVLRVAGPRAHVLRRVPATAGALYTEPVAVGTTLGLGHLALQQRAGLKPLSPPRGLRVRSEGPIRASLETTHEWSLGRDTVRLRRVLRLWHGVPGFAQELRVKPAPGVRLVTGLGVLGVPDLPVATVGSLLYTQGRWRPGATPLGLAVLVPGGWVSRGATGRQGPHPSSQMIRLRLASDASDATAGVATVWTFVQPSASAEDWLQQLKPLRDALTTPVLFRVYLPEPSE